MGYAASPERRLEVARVWDRSKVLIRGNDAKFGGGFDLVMEGEGIEVISTPILAPLANSHIERQKGSTRRECLDWILIMSRRHLDLVLSEWFAHYNEERPHRALELKIPIAHGRIPSGRLAALSAVAGSADC